MLLTLALLGVTSPSFAEETGKTVSYADLDLNNPADVAIVYERIQDAARMVCKDSSAPWDGQATKHFNQCMQDTVDAAVQDIDNFHLTALHEQIREDVAGR
jgi:UrcA family protein